jgi:hypothetical protein
LLYVKWTGVNISLLSFLFDADPEPTSHLSADADPHQNDTNLRPLVSRPSRVRFF